MGKKIVRIGEVKEMNNGMIAKVIAYSNSHDIDVQFEDGTIVKHRYYDDFKRGTIANPNISYQTKPITTSYRVGEYRKMNCGMDATIIKYRSCTDIDIQFKDDTIVQHRTYYEFQKGRIVNPNLFKAKRIGECQKMNCGMMATIIAYQSSADIDIQFKDGTIIQHRTYAEFKKGNIANPNSFKAKRIGECRKMNCGMNATIIEYRNCTDIDIQFEDGAIVCHKLYTNFKNGLIRNPNYKIKNGELISV